MAVMLPALLLACSDPAVGGDSPAPRDDTPIEDTPLVDSRGQDAPATTDSDLVSAFFGLDDSLPMMAAAICMEAPGRDGMPLVFRRAVDGSTLDASDFEVERASGVRSRPLCATLLPANEADELRTVLLIGDLADADDAPVAVSVVGGSPRRMAWTCSGCAPSGSWRSRLGPRSRSRRERHSLTRSSGGPAAVEDVRSGRCRS
jgi:hypothetical protein